jgi:hypothetical protein
MPLQGLDAWLFGIEAGLVLPATAETLTAIVLPAQTILYTLCVMIEQCCMCTL